MLIVNYRIKMVFKSAKFTIFLNIVRVMGWFPYRWNLSGKDAKVFLPPSARCSSKCSGDGGSERLSGLFSPATSTSSSVRPSWLWVCWSVLMACVTLVNSAAGLYFVISSSYYVNMLTLKWSRIFYDIFKLIVGLLMLWYCLRHCSTLAKLTQAAEELCQELKLENISFIKKRAMLTPLSTQFASLLLIMIGSGYHSEWNMYSVMALLVDMFNFTNRTIFVAVTNALYYNFISLLTEAYTQSIDPLLASIAVAKHTRDFDNNGECASQNHQNRPINLVQNHGNSSSVPRPDSSGNVTRLYDVGRAILRLQDFHAQINSYYEGAITYTIAYSVFSCILSLFYFSMFGYLDIPAHLITFVYLFLSVVPLIVLTNTPLKLQRKVILCFTVPVSHLIMHVYAF